VFHAIQIVRVFRLLDPPVQHSSRALQSLALPTVSEGGWAAGWAGACYLVALKTKVALFGYGKVVTEIESQEAVSRSPAECFGDDTSLECVCARAVVLVVEDKAHTIADSEAAKPRTQCVVLSTSEPALVVFNAYGS